jgi:hypothetical protein
MLAVLIMVKVKNLQGIKTPLASLCKWKLGIADKVISFFHGPDIFAWSKGNLS